MMRPDTLTPAELNAWQDELTLHATEQIRAVLADVPAVCLSLLAHGAQPAALPLAELLAQFLDQMTLEHHSHAMDALAELLPWVDCHALAAWLVAQTDQHKAKMIPECRHKIADAYLALCLQRNGTPSFIHQHNHLELSVELVGLAISNHIEGALLESRGPLAGLDACLTMLGAMLAPDGHSLAPMGVTVMDELFRSLVEEYSGNDLPIQKARH